MDALELVLSNDHVAQGSSILQDKHGVVRAYIQLAPSIWTRFLWTNRYHRRCCRHDHGRTPGCPDQHCP